MKDFILRTYISLARGENWSTSEIGDAVDIFDKEELLCSFPTIQINHVENQDLVNAVCEAWEIDEVGFSKRMIFPKPTETQNLVYSSDLRRIFGIERLRFTEGFDKYGNFILPAGRGFMMPEKKGGQITGFKFYSYGILKRKAA